LPTVLTRGAGSARGFGLFESGITTRKETFTSNGSWVCPAGVTSLIYVRGKGQDGTSDYPSTFPRTYTAFGAGSGTGANPAPADWSTLYGDATANYSQITVGAISGPTSLYVSNVTVYPNGSWSYTSSANLNLDGYYISYLSPLNSTGSAATSGTIAYAGGGFSYGNWAFSFTRINYGSAGADTTGFGYTFAGGSLTGSYPNQVGDAATVTTYTSVSVTPGTTYNFVVPSGGYVEFAYYT